MFESVQYFFEVGGWAMYGILLCSITALAIFLERLWTLRPKRVIPRSLYIDVEASLYKGQIDNALTMCRKDNSSLAKIFYQGLIQAGHGLVAVKEMFEEEKERQSFVLERGIGVLNMIITLAPLLGFLGTVLGMVELFTSIAIEGEIQNIGVIAGGVYKALYTTVAGLTVAIPTTLFHKICLSAVDQRLLAIEELSLKLLSVLSNSNQASSV
jgi:biopolymer transport protein ExbB